MTVLITASGAAFRFSKNAVTLIRVPRWFLCLSLRHCFDNRTSTTLNVILIDISLYFSVGIRIFCRYKDASGQTYLLQCAQNSNTRQSQEKVIWLDFNHGGYQSTNYQSLSLDRSRQSKREICCPFSISF